MISILVPDDIGVLVGVRQQLWNVEACTGYTVYSVYHVISCVYVSMSICFLFFVYAVFFFGGGSAGDIPKHVISQARFVHIIYPNISQLSP